MSPKSQKQALASFGKRLQHKRKEQEISQITLSIRAKVALNYIGEIENGKRNVRLITILKLAKGLGISPSEFFE